MRRRTNFGLATIALAAGGCANGPSSSAGELARTGLRLTGEAALRAAGAEMVGMETTATFQPGSGRGEDSHWSEDWVWRGEGTSRHLEDDTGQ